MQYFILYKTTNLINNKVYIGIHQTKNLDDGYLGSGLAFKRALKKYGKENFKREILKYCNSLEELLQEEKEYVTENWVNREDTYNLKTGGQSNGILSKDSKTKISETLKERYKKGEIIYHGKPYTPTNEIKQKISIALKEKYKKTKHSSVGRVPWNKGVKGKQTAWNKGVSTGPKSEEEKKKISQTQKKIRQNNPELNKIQSEKLKEYYRLNIHPNKGKEAHNKGKERPKTKCPHCNKVVDIGNGKRWHFENCKFR